MIIRLTAFTRDDPSGQLTILHEILDSMDIPEQRKKDFYWLLRNLSIRNSEHPKYEEAISLLKKLVRG